MNHRERLIRRAEGILASGNRIPFDLFVSLMNEGVDVEELERKPRDPAVLSELAELDGLNL